MLAHTGTDTGRFKAYKTAFMDWVALVGGLIIAYLLHSIYKAWRESRAPPPEPTKWMVGDITELTLASHSGYDWSKPTLIAVKGVVYDVSKSNDKYGPGELGELSKSGIGCIRID